ncbi:Clp protease ClpP [Pseudocitrobacter sp. 2023EL-00150]|uniref:ClpP-like prohead protease/major capsid protein fusion protein n=1 Tax=Pseudocitrobacter sp. 2023EL-00150 TaxID=3032322 RepID=UPI0023E4541C|nr:ClpP-like prohead protease/major capsid protein fusion protein [Pseudocitrobacter sp. 2023EL-00150]MDF3830240.1 Clp protease ClpP [Pseudocitrobacter sp. 2023EL-00150]
MPKPQKRAYQRPKASVKSNSWFRMQASTDNAADIFIYDEIGYWGVTAKQFVSDLKALGDVTHINLHINSPGGDVFDGIAIFNALKHHGAAITVHIDGLAASMASVIAMVGNPVIMPENTMMMIHKPWGFAGGDANDMRDYAELLDKVESVLIPAYAQKTGKTTDEIAAMLEDETWMDGTECVALGFADQVTPSLQAMACIHSKRIEEFEKMPNNIRNMVTPPRNTTQRDPVITQPQAPQAKTDPLPDEKGIRAQILAEQKNRVNGINDLFAMFGGKHSELQNTCIADPECSVEQAKDALLAALGKTATPSNKTTDAHIYAGNGNFTGDGIRQALMARAGFENQERDNVYNGMTLREYARMALTERGIGVSSYNPMQMVGLALTHSTSDFGNILLDVANKALLQGWEEAEETFQKWTKKGQLSDFKTAHRVGLGGFPSLRQVREGAEYKYVTTGDKGETIALATYGEIFSVTRQAIINDDLNQLTDVPMKMGRAAKGTIGDLVYAILTKNPKLSDGKALFHADHKNLSAGAISVAALDDARKLMRLQKEGERSLNIRPAYMLVPVGLETLANQTIKSASVKGADINAGIINPIQNFAEVIAEPRLDDADTKAWYLAAAQGTDTIEVAYLNGVDTPYIDQQEGFSTDGIATKVRIDAGVAPLDYRGMAKSSGA